MARKVRIEMDKPQWSYTQFLGFLLIYAAHADVEYTDEEKHLIESIVGADDYGELYDTFNALTDYQVLEMIRDHKELYYPTDVEKETLLHEIEKLFHVDGNYSSMEKTLLLFLGNLL